MRAQKKKSFVGVVVIGRNEGDRLVAALRSVDAERDVVVYVDSGSTDDSVEVARQAGAVIVALDLTLPFSAARARNAGVAELTKVAPRIEFVQCLDGDCELDENWLETAQSFLHADPRVALVCGRRRERFPERSIYNKLCDIEWDTPLGSAMESGGDFLVRLKAFSQVGGFRDSLVAGEEPDLCARLRAAGWWIWRIDAEMTRHDANILRFGQWWRRSERCGVSYAALAQLHGSGPDRLKQRHLRSAVLWGGVLPLGIGVASVCYPPLVALSVIYVVQALRIAARSGLPRADATIFGASVMLAKFAELTGAGKFYFRQWFGRQQELIEYK